MELQGMDSGKHKSFNETTELVECCYALAEAKQLKISMKNKLKEIIRKQLMNINELQQKCEESFIAINQLPKNLVVIAERFEKTMKFINTIQNKQIAVNEVLNVTMKGFDDVTMLNNYSKEQFDSELELASQRHMIYETNMVEIKKLSESIIDSLRNNINSTACALTKVEDILKRNCNQIILNNLSYINSQIKNIEVINSEVEKESSQIEFALISLDEKLSLLNDRIKEKENNGKEELENSTSIFNESDGELSTILNKLEYILSVNNDFSNQLSGLKKKLAEETEKSLATISALSQEISLKKPELDLLKSELEIIISNCHKLNETVKLVSETEELIILTDSSLSQLKTENNNLKLIKENFPREVENIRENIDILKNIISKVQNKIEEMASSFNNFNQLVSGAQETYEEENNSSGKKIDELISKINNVKLKKTNNSVQVKKEKLDIFSTEKETLIFKKHELIEIQTKNKVRKEELRENKKDITLRLSNISTKNEVLLSETNGIHEKKEIIESLIKQVNLEKEKKKELLSNFRKELWNMNEAFNNKQEAQLDEYLQMREIKHKELEKLEDELSRTEYTYDVISARIKKHKFELKRVERTHQKFDCKYELLMRLVDWLQNHPFFTTSADTSATSEENPSELPKDKEMLNKKKGIQILSEEAEKVSLNNSLEEGDNLEREMVVQKYVVPTLVEDEEDSSQIKYPPLPKQFLRQSTASLLRNAWGPSIKKKARVEPYRRTILDRVINSTDSQSSA